MLRPVSATTIEGPNPLARTRKGSDRIGDLALYGLTALAALIGLLIILAIIWRVADGSWPAMKAFNISFIWHNQWNVVKNQFGARDLIIGTVITSFGAMLISAPLSIAIGLFLSELAPPSIRGPIGTLIDMLAAVPSVVVGLWGIFVLAPFDAQHVQPFLGETLGWIPIFAHGQDKVESTVFTAIVVLTIMTIPITSSICRELFLGVPEELEEASLGLGATRWEMVKTVVVPGVRGGVVAAIILGLGRALGEAIAVTQVIGNFIPLKLLIYLGFILLVITFVANFTARSIVKRFELGRRGA
jgi:phosphate transport system permease protein